MRGCSYLDRKDKKNELDCFRRIIFLIDMPLSSTNRGKSIAPAASLV